MSDDPNPQLRAELMAALEVLEPQIRGLHYLATDTPAGELLDDIKKQISYRERRRDLISAVIRSLDQVVSDLDALEEDGYPELVTTGVDAAELGQLSTEVSDVEAAAKLFTLAIASQISINLGEAADKSEL